MKIKLRKVDWVKLRQHILKDISYGEVGTFNHVKKGNEFLFDEKEAEKVKRIIQQTDIQFYK